MYLKELNFDFLRCRLTTLMWVILCNVVAGAPLLADDTEKLQAWIREFDSQILPLLKSHCLDCHSGEDASGELDLAPIADGVSAAKKLEMWDEVGKRIRLNEMPPAGSPQLTDPQKAAFYAWLDSRPQQDLCNQLATDETQAWYQGTVMSRRLTRTEYLNSLRDLVGIPVDPQWEIPSDGAGGEGFDTNGGSLFTSPIHIEQYMSAAWDTLGRALQLVENRGSDDGKVFDRFVADYLVGDVSRDKRSEDELAAELIRRFAYRAWRRPITEADHQRLMELYRFGKGGFSQIQEPHETSETAVNVNSGANPGGPLVSQASTTAIQDGFERGSWGDRFTPEARRGLRQALTGVLASPHFLFVVEAESPAGGVQRLTQHELATRLALFLWSSVPDFELLAAAEQNQLDTNEQIWAQTQRMLADSRSRSLGENFGLQWLGLKNFLETVKPDSEIFPDYRPDLANDLREEVVRSIAAIFQDNRSVLELIDSEHVIVNQRLADFYGIGWESEGDWKGVPAAQSGRGGVITMGAVLMSTSYPQRTSPVLRGRWLLEEILGSPVPPPPPGVPALSESISGQAATLRQSLELHRRNPECASCHDRMDPLGFGLENFDGLGRWRDADHGLPIDATGKLPNGQEFEGPSQLKKILLQRSAEFEGHLTRKLLGFALGRSLTKFDQCVIDDSLKALTENDHRSGEIVRVIVTSFAFQNRYFKAAE